MWKNKEISNKNFLIFEEDCVYSDNKWYDEPNMKYYYSDIETDYTYKIFDSKNLLNFSKYIHECHLYNLFDKQTLRNSKINSMEI